MAKPKVSKARRLPVATAWPDKNLSDVEFAQWVETHSLKKLLGTAERVPIAVGQQKPQQPKDVPGRARVALRIPREDLEAVRQIAREKEVSSSDLLQIWIRQRLRREQRRVAAG